MAIVAIHFSQNNLNVTCLNWGLPLVVSHGIADGFSIAVMAAIYIELPPIQRLARISINYYPWDG